MEQRRLKSHSHWYHETQTTLTARAQPLVPEAAEIEDRFLLGLATLCEGALRQALQEAQPALLASRDLYQLLFPSSLTPSLTHTLTLYDRLSTALTVAQVTGVQRLCNHYAARLNPLSGPDSSRESNRRLTQITEYARQLAMQPTLIDRAALLRLDEAGLSAPDIITFSQIIGFVCYQARVTAGLHALLALPVRWMPGVTVPSDADEHCFNDIADWQPRLSPVELRYASPSQLAALTFCQPQQALSRSAWLLAHDGETLYGWGQLINVLDEKAATPEGQLAAAVAARINGSPVCFNRYAPEALRAGLKTNVEEAGKNAGAAERAVMQAAAQLTRSPERFSAAHLQPLEAEGFSLQQRLNVIFSTALAGWANRLMQSLGES